MTFLDDLYPQFQDLLLQIRAIRKGDAAFSETILKRWEESCIEMDEIFRDRLFLLVVAAEEGWTIASDVAFRKRSNRSDKVKVSPWHMG